MKRAFPKNFIWAAATAAPQIEGSVSRAGKGESIWDHWAATPGNIENGDTLEPACGHYRRWRSDFKLLARLGLKHYRMSIAWPRVFPEGSGRLNQKGLDFYRRQIDQLNALGITPWVTLFHWDLPQALEVQGGWRVRGTVDAFARYAETVVRGLGDGVGRWFTLNEIHCFTLNGYGGGGKAPGTSEPRQTVMQTVHHALLAHGRAVQAVREYGKTGALVGLVEDVKGVVPFSTSKEDISATRRRFIERNAGILGAIYGGGYSPDYLRSLGRDRPRVDSPDFAIISAPTDFLGVNIYTASWIRAGRDGAPEQLPFSEDYPSSTCRWLKLVPEAMYWTPRFCAEIFKPKDIYVTENGFGFEDRVGPDGCIADLSRRMAIRMYLSELARAVDDGVPVRGYFAWSLMDNFEWKDGYSKRFGLYHVDYRTQKRTPKLTAGWYSRVVKGKEHF